MKTVVQTFERAFSVMRSRNWDKIYVAVDLHETVVLPTWEVKLSETYYPFAKECLLLLSKREDIVLIQWSSSLLTVNLEYNHKFNMQGINFKWVNSNGDVPSTEYADFDSKFYMNVILDDKAGFEGEKDWEPLYNYLKTLN